MIYEVYSTELYNSYLVTSSFYAEYVRLDFHFSFVGVLVLVLQKQINSLCLERTITKDSHESQSSAERY